ncbi:zinc-ribbon domain-containing protein [Lutibacter sp.]|uniref:zinc-ribbon domain-containing protein n=1 Tax=Lutibacter sp. TaxID=1925666 RepID=UPI001A349988|nr:zinc-ribbon domain-containing protein [Lutibacter sp.]MBI9040598.1 zinc-ribbon domain-containing protein [Lutibacter sp.]
MSYCSNCGINNPLEAKFCPSCGTKIGIEASKKHLSSYKEKMYKNTIIGLKNEGKKIVENKAKEVFNSALSKSKNISEESQSISEVFKATKTFNNEVEEPNSSTKKINKWTWIYIIITVLLLYFGNQSEEVIGVLIFSILILGIVFFRRKKEKPYNWLVKIIIGVQLIFLVALVADRLENFSAITILFIGLLITNIMLLLKGNNS